MQDLFARTLSQGFQAFMPAAVWLVWLRRSGQFAAVSAVRRGLLAAIPLTALVGWLFQASDSQARWESLMAIGATALVLACGVSMWRRAVSPSAGTVERRATVRQNAIAAGAALIVVRQTMIIAATFAAAAFQMRSLDATTAIASAAGLALATATGWVFLGNRLSRRAVLNATQAFAVVFLAQVAFYAVHRSAEARLLPWGDIIDVATEPYGPDSVFGRYVSSLLVGLPVMAAAWSAVRDRYGRAQHRPPVVARVRRATLAASGMLAAAGIVVAATAARGVIMPPASESAFAGSAIGLTSIIAAPHVIFLSKGIDANDGMLRVPPLQAPATTRASGTLRCERVSFAGGQGICLQADRGLFTTYRAVLFNERLQSRLSFKLEGSPSRTRISADGRVGAITIFVTGHGYASSSFSTKTMLIDMASGDVLGDLEQFTTWRDGKRFSAADFNFWGVTFARDSNIFYASLRTVADVQSPAGQVTRRRQTFLVRGDLGPRKLTVLHENVECPSPSPNNRLIAYKKNVGAGPAPWRFYVLDLATMNERPIAAETRSIDDQIEWLDETHVLYGTFRSSRSAAIDVSVASIEGSEPAAVFLPAAESPIVVR